MMSLYRIHVNLAQLQTTTRVSKIIGHPRCCFVYYCFFLACSKMKPPMVITANPIKGDQFK